MTAIPLLFSALCDDASMFPPKGARVRDALAEHLKRRESAGAALVRSLVVDVDRWPDLTEAVAKGKVSEDVPVTVTFPGGPSGASRVLSEDRPKGMSVVGLEFAVPEALSASEFFEELGAVPTPDGVEVRIEIPTSEHHVEFLAALTGTEYVAKLRTGGVESAMYPTEKELAESILALVASGVRFKATGGLHRGVRNTDEKTRFEHHGFLNVLVATHRALEGAVVAPIEEALATRDAEQIVAELNELDPAQVTHLRETFQSFGTCSIDEPLEDLVALGLVPAAVKPS